MACLFPMHFCELDYTLSKSIPKMNGGGKNQMAQKKYSKAET